MCAGAIHDSGTLPAINSSRRCRASARSFFARFLLPAAQRSGVGRFGEVHDGADSLQLLDHEPPAGRRLQRDLQLPAAKPSKEPAHARAVGRRDPRP
jgi:hypothetical protein